MWDPVGNTIYTTRDLTWLQRMYFTNPLSEKEWDMLPLDTAGDDLQAPAKAQPDEQDSGHDGDDNDISQPDIKGAPGAPMAFGGGGTRSNDSSGDVCLRKAEIMRTDE